MAIWTDKKTTEKGHGPHIQLLILYELRYFDRTVYVLQVILFYIIPLNHLFTCLSDNVSTVLTEMMIDKADKFLDHFIFW